MRDRRLGVVSGPAKVESRQAPHLLRWVTIDAKRGLITVFMVQRAGFPKDGTQSRAAFRKAAEERFGTAGK